MSVRFLFESDGAWSGEDGLWPTDGAVIVDDITVTTRSGNTLIATNTETFEAGTVGANASGIWTGAPGPSFGGSSDPAHPVFASNQYGTLYPGVSLLQEDPCLKVFLFVVGFFDTPAGTNYNCHVPDPRPDIGAMAYQTGGIYMDNEVVSPAFPNAGFGVEFRLEYLTYRDLPLDNLQFYYWRVRSWTGPLPPASGGPRARGTTTTSFTSVRTRTGSACPNPSERG
jgi:hypothetical protein